MRNEHTVMVFCVQALFRNVHNIKRWEDDIRSECTAGLQLHALCICILSSPTSTE